MSQGVEVPLSPQQRAQLEMLKGMIRQVAGSVTMVMKADRPRREIRLRLEAERGGGEADAALDTLLEGLKESLIQVAGCFGLSVKLYEV